MVYDIHVRPQSVECDFTVVMDTHARARNQGGPPPVRQSEDSSANQVPSNSLGQNDSNQGTTKVLEIGLGLV